MNYAYLILLFLLLFMIRCILYTIGMEIIVDVVMFNLVYTMYIMGSFNALESKQLFLWGYLGDFIGSNSKDFVYLPTEYRISTQTTKARLLYYLFCGIGSICLSLCITLIIHKVFNCALLNTFLICMVLHYILRDQIFSTLEWCMDQVGQKIIQSRTDKYINSRKTNIIFRNKTVATMMGYVFSNIAIFKGLSARGEDYLLKDTELDDVFTELRALSAENPDSVTLEEIQFLIDNRFPFDNLPHSDLLQFIEFLPPYVYGCENFQFKMEETKYEIFRLYALLHDAVYRENRFIRAEVLAHEFVFLCWQQRIGFIMLCMTSLLLKPFVVLLIQHNYLILIAGLLLGGLLFWFNYKHINLKVYAVRIAIMWISALLVLHTCLQPWGFLLGWFSFQLSMTLYNVALHYYSYVAAFKKSSTCVDKNGST